MAYNPFRDRHKFQDDVWGQIMLNDLERDVIDTPEFQRLFRTSQLGFVDLVYQAANHTRGAHSIGACYISNVLVSRLLENTVRLNEEHPGRFADFDISPSERVLIRLGALLHDISHVPLSHDLEKKTHRIPYPIAGQETQEIKIRSWYGHYSKHDDYELNPLLYRLLCDRQHSVLARVLSRYSKPFYEALFEDVKVMRDAKPIHRHMTLFAQAVADANAESWNVEERLLPDLVFHLLTYETEKEAENKVREIAVDFDTHGQPKKIRWGIGPEGKWEDLHDLWYQPFRHDIIGNTLSADLIDYLTRDPQRMGTKRRVDLHLLNYYVLLPSSYVPKRSAADSAEGPNQGRYRCAIDLRDLKRGTTRVLLLNDIFRLLDLRQDIHEKAVMHRVVQSANAMLARGILLLGDSKPKLPELVPVGHHDHALQGEDLFFHSLLRSCGEKPAGSLREAERIFRKLTERRVYRPLMIIPGDRAFHKKLCPEPAALGASDNEHRIRNDLCLRTLATVVDSTYYSSFLLFVCMIVEKYLDGTFDTDEEAFVYAARISAAGGDATVLQNAMRMVPSRVITWTTPYKQLYKDPAVVVAVGEIVESVDEIVTKSTARLPQYEDIAGRVNSGIADADSKYATLWQLQVFISDGLFYSGLLNKLIAAAEIPDKPDGKRDSHVQRLNNAQDLLAEAFFKIRDDWPRLTGHLDSAAAVAEVLNSSQTRDDFRELVHRWATDCARARRDGAKPAAGLSTVDIDHYAHDYSLCHPVQAKEGRNCRDTRYKFDRVASAGWEKAKNEPSSAAYGLVEFLEKLGIRNQKLLSEMEFNELVQRFGSEETRLAREQVIAELNSGRLPGWSDLKVLWQTGLPALAVESPEEAALPKTREDTKRWLRQRSAKLLPHVERQFNSSIDSGAMLDLIEWAVPRRGRKNVFDYMEAKFENEASMIWNNVKEDQILSGLRRAWGYTDKGGIVVSAGKVGSLDTQPTPLKPTNL